MRVRARLLPIAASLALHAALIGTAVVIAGSLAPSGQVIFLEMTALETPPAPRPIAPPEVRRPAPPKPVRAAEPPSAEMPRPLPVLPAPPPSVPPVAATAPAE